MQNKRKDDVLNGIIYGFVAGCAFCMLVTFLFDFIRHQT